MAKILGLDNFKDDIIKMYVEENIPATKIALRYHCGNTAIYDLLRKYNVQRRKSNESRRTISFNECYMDEIDTPEKAYILGLLGSDGCNMPVKTAYRVTLSLSSIDIDVLEKIKLLFNSKHEIKIRQGKLNKTSGNYSHETASLVFHNKHLSLTLEKHGIVNNKTFKLHFPEWLPKNLLPHYIRGLFDGDGGTTISKRNTLFVHYTGDYDFLKQLSLILEQQGFKNYLKLKKESENGKTGSIHIYAKQTVKDFLDWIYKDSTIHINRKYERYYSYYYEHKPLQTYSSDERYKYNKYKNPETGEINLKES